MDIFRSPSFLTCPTKSSNKKASLTNQTSTFKFYNKSPFFRRYLSLPRRRNVQILAHFGGGGPTARRNTLRKKLIDEHQQVRHNNLVPPSDPNSSITQNSDPSFSSFEILGDNLNHVWAKETTADHVEELKSKYSGDSVLWNKLENWVDQYKKDVEFWGIGSGPIFMVFHDSNGAVKRVEVNENEILSRSQVEDLTEVNSKIFHAKSLAKEMENGENVILMNSSVAKFVLEGQEKSCYSMAVQGFTLQPKFFKKVVPRAGIMILCGFVLIWGLKKLFDFGKKEVKYTELEKEMMRRKIKSRKEREMLDQKGNVEIVQLGLQPKKVPIEKPKLDKQELLNRLKNAKTKEKEHVVELDVKVEEIKDMGSEELLVDPSKGDLGNAMEGSYKKKSNELNLEDCENDLDLTVAMDSNNTNVESHESENDPMRRKPKVIMSVKEARQYLLEKCQKEDSNQEIQVKNEEASANAFDIKGDKESKVSLSEDDYQGSNESSNTGSDVRTENWLEENFHEVEPIVKRIGVGFRDNYMVARERCQEFNIDSTLTQLKSDNENDYEDDLDWMKDDNLREIVFKVQENELAGRDPFHSMDDDDKLAFFNGLEKKVERENKKLSKLHEWLHSNIENLDYGADGISLYDRPEKVIPRWRGPPLEKSPEFFNDFLEKRSEIFTAKDEISDTLNKKKANNSLKSIESNSNEKITTSSEASHRKVVVPKTVIEGSDGSVQVGKKSGKEFWKHTKKWSRGFLDSYNAETDPEVKSIMKDMGKDLDRWITEKEIQEAAELVTKLPERNKKFMEEKLDKLKREMELFGPQAVVSKYREYADGKEEDYLWWLDLPHVLCIELYTIHDGEERIGFYSLEMAQDLELEPKPCNVIAFEDAVDCKNLCYIIQAHLEMLGKGGSAFVVACPPKEAFREAKENRFGVTVIRKGELEINVDQTLEEVEEQISEIGGKMYHDMISKDRSVDINSLMKGVFGVSSNKHTKTKRKRSKTLLKKPSKK